MRVIAPDGSVTQPRVGLGRMNAADPSGTIVLEPVVRRGGWTVLGAPAPTMFDIDVTSRYRAAAQRWRGTRVRGM